MKRIRALLIVLSRIFGPPALILAAGWISYGLWNDIWVFNERTVFAGFAIGLVEAGIGVLLWLFWMLSTLEMERTEREEKAKLSGK
jgi:hypothetical protein